ncbi:MAG: IclR family transcriptional regulator [Aminobacterium sp.]|jgi:DNA-binding IclR family transcriptional regulator|uniref:Transcriptional repressor IclR n=1 Tax=bioreactor metagenome TaxID=1076179 RepID=A0A645E334_9ZZZZ|nr:IclR family transcriptional regulator C-terminal domain-containing protein [Aminobacterium sp.]MDD2207331.1 IclR family transcriptional regulator [Aminobacterium sp.]MDD4229675.1 IclR family transcriptional regulator [Aminobacterium sp.]MDD4552175.1 IclR family transcriptional regulator [Aminobacterium sp.]MEA4877904.1 IclR family transcriptional regulator [Aminobacterium sp.]
MAENSLQLVDRVVSIMGFLSEKQEAIGVSEIARSVELSKATVHRILNTLLGYSLVLKNERGQYQIGPGVLLWANSYRKRSGLSAVSAPFLKELLAFTEETIHLFIFENGEGYYLERVESPQPLITRSAVGSKLPLHSSSAGKAILAALPLDVFNEFMEKIEFTPRTPNSITDKEVLRDQIAKWRKLGYSEEIEENEPGIRCVGAAICDSKGYPIGAISVSAPAFRFDDEKSALVGRKLREVTAAISAKFGA